MKQSNDGNDLDHALWPRVLRLALAAVCLQLGSAASADAGWFNPSWMYRKAIIVNGGNCGASPCIAAAQTDFPVLVSLTADADLAARALDSGDDLVFTAGDGTTQLDHEIELFDGVGTGQLVAWVRVPSLPAGFDSTLFIYYGNALSPSQENPTGVWDASFRGVWHLPEDPSAGQMLDSTSNANHGTPLGTMTAADQVTGVIGGALDMDAIDDRLDAGSAASLDDLGTLTASSWVFPNVSTSAPTIVSKRMASSPTTRWFLEIDNTAPENAAFEFLRGHATTDLRRVSSNAVASFTGWQHVTMTWDGTSSAAGVHIYLDGVEVTYQTTQNGVGALGSDAAANFYIGGQDNTSNSFDGLMDEVRLSDFERPLSWIQTEYRNGAFQGVGAGRFLLALGPEEVVGATAVELVSFSAAGVDGAVELRWQTGSELDNLGFHLYRSASEDGPWQPITAAMIPGLGSSPEGAAYGYRDGGLVNGATYHYLLEDVETTGRRERHGPVSAVPAAGGESAPGHGEPAIAGDDAAGWIRFGAPERSALRVEARGPRHLELELETGGFYALPRPDGSVALRVPGFDLLGEPGAPELPVRRTWLEAVAGRRVRVGRVRVTEVERLASLRPAGGVPLELVSGPDGTQRLLRAASRARAPHAAGVLPEQPARVIEVGFQGDRKRALLELAPLRWDGVSGELLLARRLRVSIAFDGVEPGEVALGGPRGRRPRDVPRGRRGSVPLAYLSAPAAGAYAVRFEELFPGQRKPLRASRLRLSHRGEDVAFHLETSSRGFGPGSVLYFVSSGPGENRFASEAVYLLESGGRGPTMAVRDAAPTGRVLEHAFVRRDFETNRLYLAGLVDALDRWLWDIVVSPRTRTYPVDLDGLVPGVPARLEMHLHGASDTAADPDHHVRVSINGVVVADARWDGKQPHGITATLAPGVLVEGANSLEILNVGDTGAPVSGVYLDRFSIEYPHALAARDGAFEARHDAAGQVAVSGLDADAVVLGVDDVRGPIWLTGVQSAGGAVAFSVARGRTLAVSRSALLRPQVRRPTRQRLSDAAVAADYVAIGPRAFLEAAQPLLQWRRDQGLSVLEAPIEDVFDAFGGGEPHPEALRAFLSFAYHEWETPPRYALLLGDATYDPRGYLGAPSGNHVPPWMLRTPYMWTLSDSAYAAVNGEDDLPDLAIGRLPAADADQARALALKVVAFERDGYSFDGAPAVLVADNADEAGDFPGDAEAIASTIFAGRDVETLRVDELGAATRSAIQDALDGGTGIVSYLGHGGIAMWASENVFNNLDVAGLAPQPQQPLLLTINCLNGYILNPRVDSLAEAFLKAEGRGAVAAFSPSSLSIHGSARVYHDLLLEELLSGRHARLGDALVAAQVRYADRGGLPDLLASYLLLADPAMRLR